LLDPATKSILAGLTDPADKVAACADHVFACISAGADLTFIEQQIGLRPGALAGLILNDRSLVIRYAVALTDAAQVHDRRAQAILVHLASVSTRCEQTRALFNLSNSLRCEAEALRCLSAGVLRRTTLTADREEARNRGRYMRAWDVIAAGHRSYLPAVGFTPSPSAITPLEIARELLPALKAEVAMRTADGDDTLLLKRQISLTEGYIRRQTKQQESQ
jgi:hypothetical protein